MQKAPGQLLEALPPRLQDPLGVMNTVEVLGTILELAEGFLGHCPAKTAQTPRMRPECDKHLLGTPNLRCWVIWRQMIGRESPMATTLRRGDVIEVINVLSLPLCLEGFFKCLKRHRGVVINSYKPAVIEYSSGSNWGGARVSSVGNVNVEFGDV